MPIIKTPEQLLASKINPINPSTTLNTIYFLRKRVNADYIASSPNRIVWAASDIGTGTGTSKSFTTLSPTSYNKNTANITITLAGTASYILTSGVSITGVRPAIKIIAQIDVGNTDSGFPALQVEATASEISSDGSFSFVIPNSIVKELAVGNHTVYLDASSPSSTTRLTVSGKTDGVQTFAITAS